MIPNPLARRSRLHVLAALAVAVPLWTGCDSATEPLGTDDAPAAPCTGALLVRVDPTATYLRASDDPAANAAAVALSGLGLQPGDRLRLEIRGDYQYRNNTPTEVRDDLFAVFSRTATLGPAGDSRRVVDALDAGQDAATRSTFSGGLSTDIPEDFAVTTTEVTVPAGAAFLFFTPNDDQFNDNLDEDGDYSACVTKL